MIDRKKNAATEVSEPKLLLLGGSATLFGIKASVIQYELGIPTVNGGLHAGLGMDMILREARGMLRSGDTVVLFPEYELLDFGENNRQAWAAITYLDYMLSRDSKRYLELAFSDQLQIALMTPADRIWKGIKGRWIPESPPIGSDYNPYDAAWVDSHGDMTGHRAFRRPEHAQDRDQRICEVLCHRLSLEEEGFALIAEFKHWADAQQVRLIAGFPNMAHRQAYKTSTVDEVEDQLKGFYANHAIDVVGGLRESLMHSDDFFDTLYHPTEEASILRSHKLATKLRPLLMDAIR
jgi:hypothetical protein